MLKQRQTTPSSEDELRQMAVEIVLFDEEERPRQPAKVELINYLRPSEGPSPLRAGQRG
jgi:hypothetical protein